MYAECRRDLPMTLTEMLVILIPSNIIGVLIGWGIAATIIRFAERRVKL